MSRQRRGKLAKQGTSVEPEPHVLGGSLANFKCAGVAIYHTTKQGEFYAYGTVPIFVAKCGLYLKEMGAYQILLSINI